jgi:hypothetical protein
MYWSAADWQAEARLTEEQADIARSLRGRILAAMGTAAWQGPAADRFRERATGLLTMIARAAGLLDAAAADFRQRAAQAAQGWHAPMLPPGTAPSCPAPSSPAPGGSK